MVLDREGVVVVPGETVLNLGAKERGALTAHTADEGMMMLSEGVTELKAAIGSPPDNTSLDKYPTGTINRRHRDCAGECMHNFCLN